MTTMKNTDDEGTAENHVPLPKHEKGLHIVAIAGSLRHDSFNRALLEAASELAPPDVRVDIVDISDIPLYNQDLDNDEDRPPAVSALKSAVAGADAVLFASPEYNFGISGVMKNVIDWLSRPAMRSPLARKPVGFMGASPGALGTARAQENLKTVLLATLAVLFPHPGVVVGGATAKFKNGRLAHTETREFVANYMRQFADWVRDTSRISQAA